MSQNPAGLKMAITGYRGQLGTALCRLNPDLIPLSREDCPLEDAAVMRERLQQLRPSVVINCAAYTAVDQAESDREHCYLINADAVASMADACNRIGALLVQVSTDYVFCGDAHRRQPFTEDEPVCPQGVYASSKAEGERRAMGCDRHLIVRTCGLYGASHRNSANFVETMLRLSNERDRLRVVNDQWCTPSYAAHVAAAMLLLIQQEQKGIFHVANGGSTTWHGLASKTLQLANRPIPCDPISTADYNARAPRPAYSVLDTSRYAKVAGSPLPDWDVALQEYLSIRLGSR